MTALFPQILPDLPVLVHGIKGRDPWLVQCDDCLTVFEEQHLSLAVRKAVFSSRLPGFRLCDDCWVGCGFIHPGGHWRPHE